MDSHNSLRCSPGNDEGGTCFDKDDLLVLADALNKVSKQKINTNCSRKKLYTTLCKRINALSDCTYEDQWLELDCLVRHIPPSVLDELESNFRPKMPIHLKKDKYAWLTNIDIDRVMQQYEDHHEDFYYYSASPIDYYLEDNGKCKVSDICAFDLKEHLDNNISRIGMVFNTDPHNKSGKHWFCIYLDLQGKNHIHPAIYHFDSTGNSPCSIMEELIQNIRNQGVDNNIDIRYYVNDIQHQQNDSECGVYSLHFLTSMLNDTQFSDYIETIKDDEYMNKFRKIFYRC
jgi:hypothetical protein